MMDIGNDPPTHHNFVHMSSSATLNENTDCIAQDVEKSAIAPKDQPPGGPEGPTKEFILFPIPRYLRHIPGDSIEFHLPRIFLLSISTIFRKVFPPELTTHFC